eukprot:447571-Prymnesium_polylepis.1
MFGGDSIYSDNGDEPAADFRSDSMFEPADSRATTLRNSAFDGPTRPSRGGSCGGLRASSYEDDDAFSVSAGSARSAGDRRALTSSTAADSRGGD